jgi:hypothetical protein
VKRLLWFAVPALAAIAACQAKVDGAATRNGTGGDGSGGSGGSSSMTASFNLQCPQVQLGSPVLRLLTASEFTNTISDIFPQVATQWSNTLPANTLSAYGFANDSSAVVGPQLAQALLDTATSIATAVTGTTLATTLPCSATSADHSCADQFVTQYGRRLFRRSLTQAEHDNYLTFFDSALAKSNFATALKWVLVGLIQSPNAVYRSEIGTAASDGTRNLSADEVATEFAYTFTGSTPSDALLTQAESGSSVDVVSLAKSLLASDAGKAQVEQFFEAYLGYPQVASVERTNVTNFMAVRNDMVQETRTFIDQIVQNNGGLQDLLTSPNTNPSIQLASYYGMPAPSADYASVQRPTTYGIGLLAQGSLLAANALPTSSSPTQRGLVVFSKLLCETKPTPPPNVPPPPPPAPGQVTTRQRYEEQHANGGACASCHKLFDPIGFGFEHFDEGGRYRADDGGLQINTVSDVPNPDGTPLFNFQDEPTLAQGLATQEVVYQCFAAYLATYAYGTADSCLGSSNVADFKAGTVSIMDYYASLAAEPHFVKRNAQ